MICIPKLALEMRDISLLALLLSPRLDDISTDNVSGVGFAQLFFSVWYITGHKVNTCRFCLFSLYYKNIWAATNLCLRYAPEKCGKFDISGYYFSTLVSNFASTDLRRWQTLFYLFLHFCNYQQVYKYPLSLFPTFLPQAYSLLEHSRRTDRESSSPFVP